MTSPNAGMRYRPEIDGLRAIAVGGVVLYHAGLKIPGGYVGVDVFFVISGYLITSLILRDLDQGCFSLPAFWERRVRRIVPALFVMVLATLIGGWFLNLPADYVALGKSALFQAFFAANFYFFQDTGYFAGVAEEKPLLHTWSLAVEEQFYLLVPVLLLAIYRFPVLRRRVSLLILIGVGIAFSLAGSALMMAKHQSAAFFLLPSRAWELLIGSALGVMPAAWLPKARAAREIMSLLGLAGIGIPMLLYTRETPFPGLAALPPVLGAAAFVWANDWHQCAPAPLTLSGRVLATRLPVFLGAISYSLYLWHWPIFAFSAYWSFKPHFWLYRVSLLGAGFVLAVLSWRFVEIPFRRRVVFGHRRAVFTFGGAALLAVVAAGTAIVCLDGVPARLPPALRISYNRDSPGSCFMYFHDATMEDLHNGTLAPIGIPDPKAPISVLLWGDSHAMAALPAFDSVLKKAGIAGRAATRSATAPLLGYAVDVPWGLGKQTPAYSQAVLAYIRQYSIPNVVLCAYWHAYETKGKVPADLVATQGASLLKYHQRAVLATVRELVKSGSQPWLFLQVPSQPYYVPRAHALATIFGLDETPYCAVPQAWNGVAGDGQDFLDELRAAGARIIDPRPAFLDSGGQHYRISLDGMNLYGDTNHLTKLAAEKMLSPVLEKDFVPALVSGNKSP